MFRFNRTIIGHTVNVLRFLNFFFLNKAPDDGSDEPKHETCSTLLYGIKVCV
jgi:hypothetical protein